MAYTDWRRGIAFAVAVTACGFDSGGDGVGSTGGSSGTGSTDPSTTDPSTTNPTTNPTTTMSSTTDPTSTDATTTDPATTDPSTDPTTTDPSTDPTTTDPTTGDDTTTDPSQGSTGGDPGVYGPCDANACPDDQMCAVVQDRNNTVIGNNCRPPCDDPGDCPVPATGSAQIFCPSPQYPFCVLECANSECPDGMECYPTQFGDHCHWPL
jgi:hypothetical protein